VLNGGQAQVGQTTTPVFISKFNTLMNFDYISGTTRGIYIVPHISGLSGRFIGGEEWQGNITPLISFQPYYAGNTAGFFSIMDLYNDTGPAPMVAYIAAPAASLGATIQINGSDLPSSNAPLVSGSPFASLILQNISATNALQLGQNMNTTSIGQTNGSLPGIRTASLATAAVNYTGNHTLTKAEGAVNAQGTLTFTIDTTLGDGQMWDVYSETGTTTLTVSAGTLHGNAATGNITIPNNSGMHVFLKGGNAYAYGLGGGGGGGGCTPGGTTGATLYNGGGGTCAGVNSPIVNGNYNVHYRVTGSVAVNPAIDNPGVPINAQTGTTYTIGTANTDFDRGYLITANNAGAQTYTFVNPSTTGYGFNHFFVIKNIGTGTVTATASGFTINGATTLLIAPSWTVFFWSDGINYFASRLPDFTAFPNCIGGGNALQFTTATGVFSCGSSSAGVSSITGDGIIFNNSLSTGAVTLTLVSGGANKVLANCTGAPAAPTYCNITDAMLTAASHAALYNASNVWTGLQDFSGATVKVPTGAGFTTSATSMDGYDSTAKIRHIFTNNADALAMVTTATCTTTTNIAHATAVAGIYSCGAMVTADIPVQYTKSTCTEVWGGSGSSFALTAGDDAISNNTCYNDSGVTRTITAVKCLSDNGANTTTVNPTFGASGTGTTILSGALTCGNSNAMSSSGTVSNASWTTGTGINPVMGGTLTGTHIAMIVEYTF